MVRIKALTLLAVSLPMLLPLLTLRDLAQAQPINSWRHDARLSEWTNNKMRGPGLTSAQRATIVAEVNDLDSWLNDKSVVAFRTMNGYEQVNRYIMDRWVRVLLVNAASQRDDKNLYGDGKVNYARTFKLFHSLMTSAREIKDPKEFKQFYSIDGHGLGNDSRDFKVRTVEHFATAAHAAYEAGNLPSHFASFLWNTYSVTRRQLEGVVDRRQLPANSWGQEWSHTEASESIASFWASRKPGAARLNIAGVPRVLFLDEAMKELGKDPLGMMRDYACYVLTGKTPCPPAGPYQYQTAPSDPLVRQNTPLPGERPIKDRTGHTNYK